MIEQSMIEHGVDRIVLVPADELCPYDVFHVHLASGWLAEHIGRGETYEEALKDALERVHGREAA